MHPVLRKLWKFFVLMFFSSSVVARGNLGAAICGPEPSHKEQRSMTEPDTQTGPSLEASSSSRAGCPWASHLVV